MNLFTMIIYVLVALMVSGTCMADEQGTDKNFWVNDDGQPDICDRVVVTAPANQSVSLRWKADQMLHHSDVRIMYLAFGQAFKQVSAKLHSETVFKPTKAEENDWTMSPLYSDNVLVVDLELHNFSSSSYLIFQAQLRGPDEEDWVNSTRVIVSGSQADVDGNTQRLNTTSCLAVCLGQKASLLIESSQTFQNQRVRVNRLNTQRGVFDVIAIKNWDKSKFELKGNGGPKVRLSNSYQLTLEFDEFFIKDEGMYMIESYSTNQSGYAMLYTKTHVVSVVAKKNCDPPKCEDEKKKGGERVYLSISLICVLIIGFAAGTFIQFKTKLWEKLFEKYKACKGEDKETHGVGEEAEEELTIPVMDTGGPDTDEENNP